MFNPMEAHCWCEEGVGGLMPAVWPSSDSLAVGCAKAREGKELGSETMLIKEEGI